MKPLQRFDSFVFKWLGGLLGAFGYNVIDPNYYFSYRSMLPLVFMLLANICVIYTIFIERSIFVVVSNCMGLSMTIQIFVKLYYIQRKQDIDSLISTIRKTLGACEKLKSTQLYKTINNFTLFIEYGSKGLICSVCTLIAFVYIPIPIVSYLLNGSYELMMPIYLPGVKATDSMTGCVVTSLFHWTLIGFYPIFLIAIELIWITVLVSPIIFARFIAFHSAALNLALENGTVSRAKARALFRNILLMHQEMVVYLSKLEDLYFGLCLRLMLLNALASIALLYVILTTSYFPAYGSMCSILLHILITCSLGQAVQYANDQVYVAAYNLQWILLQRREQRMYKFFVRNCQKPVVLSIGGFSDLNLNACLRIYKSIYSYTMIAYSRIA